MDIGQAVDALRDGVAVRRRGWNGKGIYIKMQAPNDNSFMTEPYVYIETSGLVSDNPDAVRGRVPWLASQTDLLATDWEV